LFQLLNDFSTISPDDFFRLVQRQTRD
jgi:hypothetical protein